MITELPDPSKTAAGRSYRFMFSFGVAFEGLREMPRRLTYAAPADASNAMFSLD